MVILAVSDVHIGYSKSNTDLFNNFLKDIIARNDVDKLVILGDFFDMWRRDVSGLFLESHNIVKSLFELKEKTSLYYVVGNHDYHLSKLKGHDYPINFLTKLKLFENGITYIFKHGWEFDPKQREPIMELLCHNLSDDNGHLRSDFWDFITCKKDFSDFFEETVISNRESQISSLNLEMEKEKFLQNLLTSPRERLAFSFGSVEKLAANEVKNKDNHILFFGHTHRPLISSDQKVVNTGSWVNDEKIFNTYAEIDGQQIRLMKYPKEDITQEITKPIR